MRNRVLHWIRALVQPGQYGLLDWQQLSLGSQTNVFHITYHWNTFGWRYRARTCKLLEARHRTYRSAVPLCLGLIRTGDLSDPQQLLHIFGKGLSHYLPGCSGLFACKAHAPPIKYIPFQRQSLFSCTFPWSTFSPDWFLLPLFAFWLLPY